eukprot:scaffold36441_cov23-Prasinocladus_malaysianus.AAC.1
MYRRCVHTIIRRAVKTAAEAVLPQLQQCGKQSTAVQSHQSSSLAVVDALHAGEAECCEQIAGMRSVKRNVHREAPSPPKCSSSSQSYSYCRDCQ